MVPDPGQSRIFISYRREDSAGHVLALLPALRRHFGADRIFKDTDNIPPGVNFLKFIKRELETCSVLLAILGKEWLTVQDPRLKRRRLDNPDDFLRLEVATALKSERIRVIPVLVERSVMPAQEDLPADLAELALRNALELSDSRWESDVERLIQAILAASEVSASPPSAQVPRSGISDLHRRRAREIAAHLQAAREAFEEHDYEAAVLVSEKALLLDPQAGEALELLERTRKAIDEQKIAEWLAGAQRLLGQGDVAGASELIDQALSLDNTSEPALALRQELLRLRREREQERERARVTLAAVTRAQASLDEDDFDAAVRHADDALELEPQSRDAQEIRSKAVAALAERRRQREHKRHAQQTVAEARALFEAGKHEDGLRQLREFGPAHDLVSQTLLELQQEVAALEQSRSQIIDLTRKAEAAAAAGRFQDAIALLHDLEGMEPGRADVAALLDRAESGLKAAAAARQARLEADARLSEASAKFQKQEYGAARQLVEAARKHEPQHPEVNRWLRRIDGAVAEQKIAADRRAAIQTALAEGTAHLEKGQFEAAIAQADTALAIDPALEDARGLRQRAGAALAERRKREAHEHLSKQTVEEAQLAFKAGNHEGAIELLERFSPPHALVTQALADLRKQFQDIDQRRRQQAEKEAKRREEAERAAAERRQADALRTILTRGQTNLGREDFDAALRDANEILSLDRHSEEAEALRSAASTGMEQRRLRADQDRLARQAAAKAREEAEEAARQRRNAEARARNEKIAAAVSAAEHSRSHEEALRCLREGLALDPANVTLRNLIEAREIARDRQEAERRQQQALAVAISAIEGHLESGQLDEAERLLTGARNDLPPSPLVEALETRALELRRHKNEQARQEEIDRWLADGQAAFAARKFRHARARAAEVLRFAPDHEIARSLLESATRERHAAIIEFWSPTRLAVIGSAAAVLLAAAWIWSGDRAPDSQPPAEQTSATAPATPPPQTSSPPEAVADRSAVPPPTESTPTPAPPRSDPPASNIPPADDARLQRLGLLRETARRQYSNGQRVQALGTVAEGLKINPNDEALQMVLASLLGDARTSAQRAKDEARGAGAPSLAQSVFTEAEALEADATKLEAANRNDPATRAFWKTADRFTLATELAEATREAQPPAVALNPVQPPLPRPNVPEKAPPSTTPQQPPSPEPSRPPLVAKPNDEALVRATLQQYESAYDALNVDAVQRVYPLVQVDALRRAFGDMRSYDLGIQIQRIEFSQDGLSATALCSVTHIVRPRAGAPSQQTRPQTFTLQKEGTRG